MADQRTPLLYPDDADEPQKLSSNNNNDDSIDSVIDKIIGEEFNWKIFLRATLVSFAWFFDAQHTFVTIFADAEPNRRLPKNSSTLSEWGLINSAGAPASAFFAGSLIGGLVFAALADSSLGRKRMLSLSCLVAATSALITALSPNPLVYAATRFAAGFGRAAIGTCALVLPTELVGRRWRAVIGVSGFVFFTLGFLSIPGIAYFNEGRSWRYLYVFISVPTVLYSISVHFLVSESPRWLLVRGRKQEAIEALSIMAGKNKTARGSQIWIDMLSTASFPNSNESFFSAVESLISKPWALRRLLVVMTIGLGNGMVYYGMPLALGNLPLSLYLSVTLNALAEFPASAMTYFLVAKARRKLSILALTTSSAALGIASSISASKNEGAILSVWLEVGSFFGACTATNMMLIFAVELFPTAVRNTAVSAVRQAVVVGGVAAPMMRGGMDSFGVFGVAIGVSGLFVAFLPETRGKALCDTLDDEERELCDGDCEPIPTHRDCYVV